MKTCVVCGKVIPDEWVQCAECSLDGDRPISNLSLRDLMMAMKRMRFEIPYLILPMPKDDEGQMTRSKRQEITMHLYTLATMIATGEVSEFSMSCSMEEDHKLRAVIRYGPGQGFIKIIGPMEKTDTFDIETELHKHEVSTQIVLEIWRHFFLDYGGQISLDQDINGGDLVDFINRLFYRYNLRPKHSTTEDAT